MVIKSRILCIWAGLLFLSLLVLPCAAQGEQQAPDQKVIEAADRVGPALDVILTAANESKSPEPKDLSSGQTVVDETKRFFLQMDDKQKAQYCLLQSWLAYFSGQIESAHLNAAKACKLDTTSGDAWATQVAMAVIADKRPMLPRPPKAARGQRSRTEGPDMMRMQDPASQMQPGKLSFDLSQFVAEALDKKIEALELSCLNGTTFQYKPGQEALCALLWQKYETKKAAVSNEPNQRGAAAPQPMPAPPMMEYEGFGGGGMYGQPAEGTPMAAFGKLFRMGLGRGQMKFLAVNLDSAEHKEAVIDEIFKQPQAFAQIVIAEQAGGSFGGFKGISPDKPLLIMTDRNGAIRYAGPAAGFIAPMALHKFTSGDAVVPLMPTETVELSVKPADSNSPAVADSNSIAKPAPAAAPKPTLTPAAAPEPAQQAVEPDNQYKELSEEDAIQAERKLVYARDLFMKMGSKPGLNYTRGVNLCREILKSYPDTEYAKQAQELLRQIPENQRARYNLTDQELGL